jgi:hypothetical protein
LYIFYDENLWNKYGELTALKFIYENGNWEYSIWATLFLLYVNSDKTARWSLRDREYYGDPLWTKGVDGGYITYYKNKIEVGYNYILEFQDHHLYAHVEIGHSVRSR